MFRVLITSTNMSIEFTGHVKDCTNHEYLECNLTCSKICNWLHVWRYHRNCCIERSETDLFFAQCIYVAFLIQFISFQQCEVTWQLFQYNIKIFLVVWTWNREEGILRLKKSEKSEVHLHERAAQSQTPCLTVTCSTKPLRSSGNRFFLCCTEKMDNYVTLTVVASTISPSTLIG